MRLTNLSLYCHHVSQGILPIGFRRFECTFWQIWFVPQGITRSKEVIPKGIAEELHIGIVRTQWNKPIIDELHRGCREKLEACGVKSANIREMEVPGAFELPYAADLMKRTCPELRAIICIGCLIKGTSCRCPRSHSTGSWLTLNLVLPQERQCILSTLLLRYLME